MSEQELEQTSKEIFMGAIEEGLSEDDQPITQESTEEQHDLQLDHQPSDNDSEEYWKEFAVSKGWKDSTEIDEANFKGYKAFVRDYDRIQENVEFKDTTKELRKQMSEVVKSNAEIAREIEAKHQREMESLKTSLEAKRDKARSEHDFDTFEAATQEINELEATAAPKLETDAPKQEHDVIVSFRTSNPEVLATSDNYDPELNKAVEDRFNFSLKTGAITNEADAPALLARILEEEKGKLSRYQAPATRTPPNTNSTKRAAKQVALDPNNLSADARSYYDHYIKKGWKDVAENFLKDSLGA